MAVATEAQGNERGRGGERVVGKERGNMNGGAKEKGIKKGNKSKGSEKKGNKEEEPQVPPPPLRVPVPDNVPTGARRVSSLEIKTFVCGALAGGAAGACTSPLESIRTRVIAHKGGDSTMQLIQRTAEDEGLRKSVLSASLKMSITMNALNRGIQFYVFEMVKKASKKWTGKENPKILPLHSVPTSSLAGTAGAFASTVLTYPFSAVSDHMSLQPGKYKGLRDAFAGISKSHGPAQLYRGIVPKLCSMVPAGAISFYTFDALKQELQKRMGREITTIESLSIGAIAGLVSTLTTYPLELARKEINMSLLPMSATRTGGYKGYNTMAQALRGIVRGGGFPGLYRGVVASALEVVPSTAISFMVYEGAKRALIAEKHEAPEEVMG